jgi:3-isopropylmalate/(R)-2-methylmalate dehydratase small subunit
LKIDLKDGVVHNQSTGAELKVQPMSGYVLEILEAGGIKPLVKKQLAQIN